MSQPSPVETRPVETRPVETRPVETWPAEARPAELRPAKLRPGEPGVIRDPRRIARRRSGAIAIGFGLCASIMVGYPALMAMPMAPEPDVTPGAFPDLSLRGWKERSFAGNTDYRIVVEDGVSVLRGHARGSASILYRERDVSLDRTPIIEWSWKVDRVYPMIDERSRGGDDFPARLYVVARTGFLPWETLAINYVWASGAMPGDRWLNPFTDKAMMIAVRAGPTDVGRWMRERRNIRADFRDAFGERVDDITGYAVMVDGDNGQLEATAWFGDLAFRPE